MKIPRIRIAWVMVFIAIAALEFAAVRRLLALPQIGELLIVGALPMANVLVVGMLVAHLRPTSRPFLLGFAVFGAMALTLYITLASYSGGTLLIDFLEPILSPLRKTIGMHRPFILGSALISTAVLILGLPQFLFALIGGSLSGRFKITVTRH